MPFRINNKAKWSHLIGGIGWQVLIGFGLVIESIENKMQWATQYMLFLSLSSHYLNDICVHWKMISFYAQSLHAFVLFSLLDANALSLYFIVLCYLILGLLHLPYDFCLFHLKRSNGMQYVGNVLLFHSYALLVLILFEENTTWFKYKSVLKNTMKCSLLFSLFNADSFFLYRYINFCSSWPKRQHRVIDILISVPYDDEPNCICNAHVELLLNRANHFTV